MKKLLLGGGAGIVALGAVLLLLENESGEEGEAFVNYNSINKVADVELVPAIIALDFESKSVFEIDGNKRLVRSNAIPQHKVGTFPNDHNPNAIEEQEQSFQVPLNPVKADEITPLVLGHSFGIAHNGVVFDPFAAEYWHPYPLLMEFNIGSSDNYWNYNAHGVHIGLDENHAHVQPGGIYHYHGMPQGAVDIGDFGADGLLHIGFAADGFPIYVGLIEGVAATSSYQLKSGERPSVDGPGGQYDGTFVQDYEFVEGIGNLDKCNGAEIVSEEFPQGTYAYFVTDAFPNVPRCFVGTPDSSFDHRVSESNG